METVYPWDKVLGRYKVSDVAESSVTVVKVLPSAIDYCHVGQITLPALVLVHIMQLQPRLAKDGYMV
jgi:hypothetical protein